MVRVILHMQHGFLSTKIRHLTVYTDVCDGEITIRK